MSIEKPLPLMVGDKAFYTLTSYDPVEVELTIPSVTDEDVELGLKMTLLDMQGTEKDLDDSAWVAEHFDGLTTKQQVLDAMRQQLTAMNTAMAEQQKMGACADELAKRLCQSIPPQHLARIRETMRMRFIQQLQEQGTTPDEFMRKSGASMEQVDAMIEEQTMSIANADAALSAFAHERKLKVDESEYGRYLGFSDEELPQVIEQARKDGMLDEMKEAALRGKALQTVVAECSCTYKHETPAQARERLARMRALQDAQSAAAQQDKPADEDGSGFQLV